MGGTLCLGAEQDCQDGEPSDLNLIAAVTMSYEAATAPSLTNATNVVDEDQSLRQIRAGRNGDAQAVGGATEGTALSQISARRPQDYDTSRDWGKQQRELRKLVEAGVGNPVFTSNYHYFVIYSGTCAGSGYDQIVTWNMCEEAAIALGLLEPLNRNYWRGHTRHRVYEENFAYESSGCIYRKYSASGVYYNIWCPCVQ